MPSHEMKPLTLDDHEGQYCNRNCIGCCAFSLATARLSCYVFAWFSHAFRLWYCCSLCVYELSF